jgi:hypothetical protein
MFERDGNVPKRSPAWVRLRPSEEPYHSSVKDSQHSALSACAALQPSNGTVCRHLPFACVLGWTISRDTHSYKKTLNVTPHNHMASVKMYSNVPPPELHRTLHFVPEPS